MQRSVSAACTCSYLDVVPGFVMPRGLVPLSNGNLLATPQFSTDSSDGRPRNLGKPIHHFHAMMLLFASSA
jgi:hypothetical protein